MEMHKVSRGEQVLVKALDESWSDANAAPACGWPTRRYADAPRTPAPPLLPPDDMHTEVSVQSITDMQAQHLTLMPALHAAHKEHACKPNLWHRYYEHAHTTADCCALAQCLRCVQP